VLAKPKNIVSGDFHWIEKHENKIFIAVSDCAELIINWYYKDDDDDMLEQGTFFSSDLDVSFNFMLIG
jgi:hypothetical protein